MVTQESKFSADETLARLEARLAEQKVPVFAKFDHDGNAREVGMQLRPTKVVVFGKPRVGTKLMQSSQPIALELPLRVLIWQDERNRVWVGHPDMDALAAEYGVKDPATVQAIKGMLERLVNGVVNVYEN
jgi:uncharacterized protein (DUF302 family)